MTIRITPRADAPAPKRKKVSSFDSFIIGKHDPARLLASLHAIIDSKSPKVCALTLLAAIQKGILTQPTYKAVREEFPEIGDRKNYAYYLSRADNYTKEIAPLLQNL